MTPVNAKQLLLNMGFNVVILGEELEHSKSKIMTQSLEVDTIVPIGTVIELSSVNFEID